MHFGRLKHLFHLYNEGLLGGLGLLFTNFNTMNYSTTCGTQDPDANINK